MYFNMIVSRYVKINNNIVVIDYRGIFSNSHCRCEQLKSPILNLEIPKD